MVYVVNSVLASGVDIILEEDFVCFALQEMEIHPLMLLIRTLSMILQTFSPTLHSPRHTRVSYVGTILTMVMIVYHGECEIKIDELKAKFNKMSIEINKITKEKELRQREQESTIPLNEITSQNPSSIAITPVLPIMEPEDSLIMGDQNLSTIPEKESDEFIKSSVEDLVPILSEFEDTSDNDSECDLHFCEDSPPLDILGGNFVTFSNPLFDSNDDFTSSDDESLSEENVLEENVKIYSNPLFEFDDEYISSDVNPLFNEVLEDIESKDSYVSNIDEPALLVTPLSDANEDDYFDPGGKIDKIDAFLDMDISTDIENGYHDLEGDIIYLESLLIDDTIPNLPPGVFLDHEPRSLNNKHDNLKSMVKVFDPEIHEKTFSPTYVRLPSEDHHYLSLTYVIRIFLPYFTYPVDSSLPLSSGSEDIIFDPDISAYSFYSSEPVAYESDVHQDELCPPNKRYALMDANKKINLDNPLYPNERKIMANIIQNHPLRFSVAASLSVPLIYLGQFWHTLHEDVLKYRLKFVLDRKEITMTDMCNGYTKKRTKTKQNRAWDWKSVRKAKPKAYSFLMGQRVPI
ncbi:hypothetical protein Tco_1329306 [Tanacetum coccineum]